MTTRIRIRGIYSTALTKLVSDWGYSVVGPSAMIRDRFGFNGPEEACDILIQDREDLQGIEVSGEPEKLCQFLTFLQERLPDVVLMHFEPLEREEDRGWARAITEFPGASKEALDALRLRVVPTLTRHHRFRIIDAKALEQAEQELASRPETRDRLAGELFMRTIILPLEKSGQVRMEHIRPSGKAMRPREGFLVRVDERGIVFKRFFSEGRYDGLDLPIQPGDYGLTEIMEGAWYVKHAYFTKEGKLQGEYLNINTPVELYPYGARYMDLEVDVIRRVGAPPFMVDREKLALLARQGSIAGSLEAKALDVAHSLMKEMN